MQRQSDGGDGVEVAAVLGVANLHGHSDVTVAE